MNKVATSVGAEPSAAPAALIQHEWQDRYSSGRDDLVGQFFQPALAASRRYDRAVGYFRSSIYALIGSAVLDFAHRGGHMRLLCSPEMAEQDIEAVRHGLDMREAVGRAADRELARMLAHPLAALPVELLANLVAAQVLEIRFAVTRGRVGVFHDKVGLFDDGEAALSFSGSANESWAAWHPLGNHESFEVFRSWREPDRVAAHRTYFESLWNRDDARIDVFDAPEAFRENLLRKAAPEPLTRLEQRLTISRQHPRRRLLDHQRDALTCWQQRGRRGVLKHATGSGKTVTALHAIRDWLAQGKPALVLVPSRLLLEQWAQEAQVELGFLEPSVLLAGGGHDEWRRNGLLRLHTQAGGGPRLVIATMQTAASKGFRQALSGNTEILVVADEAHRVGSPEHRKALGSAADARLALSATPERAGDADGTAVIFDYFGDVLEPVFTLRDAIAAGRLSPYVYEPNAVGLTPDEEDGWRVRTERIRQVYAQEVEEIKRGQMSPYLQHLLIQRARIAKKAAAKVPLACQLVKQNYQPGQHWLLYCEDRAQLRDVLDGLRGDGLEALEYHSAMLGDRDATMDRYRRLGGVLVSIRCLDEGVDIPAVSHALILASSRNYREFVQRRGRVLRTAPGKHQAHLYDLLVLPSGMGDEFDSLVYGEIVRAAEFAKDALNRNASLYLKKLCIELGLDPDQLLAAGLEDDSDQAQTEEDVGG